MGKMSLTSCRALSTPGKFSNVDRYESHCLFNVANPWILLWAKSPHKLDIVITMKEAMIDESITFNKDVK